MNDTREKILDVAFDKFYTNGYQGTGISDILNASNIHKGSLYHFFKSKKDLALTVIDERLMANLQKKYEPLMKSNQPLDELFNIFEDTTGFDFKRGCALSNLVQEMSSLDSDFKIRLQAVYTNLFDWIKLALDNASAKGLIDCPNTVGLAHLIAATVEGGLMAAKAFQDPQTYYIVIKELKSIIEGKLKQ